MDGEIRGTVIHLEGFNTTLGFDDPPEPALVLAPKIKQAAQEMTNLSTKMAAIRRDKRLSDVGRAEALSSLDADRAKVEDSLSRIEEGAKVLENINNAMLEATLEVPALDPTDHNSRMDDGEIRQWVASLQGDQRQRYLNDLVAGKYPRHARALARSPVPSPQQEMGLATLRATLSKEDQAALAQADTRKASIAWVRTATGAMRNILAKRHIGPTA